MKLVRADEHLQTLNHEVTRFLQVGPYEVVTEKDVPAGFLRARVRYRQEPPDLLFMLIGDVLHNLRSALDHLAWSLAGTKANPGTEFPIFIDPVKFHDSGLDKMHDIPPGAQAIIESLQPYNRRHGLEERIEPLWLLHRLDIEDKHRALNLVAAEVDIRLDISTHTSHHPAYGLTGRTGPLPLKDGAEIWHIPLPADPSQVTDYSHPNFDIAFDPEGPGGGIPLRQGLRDMWEAVEEAIHLLAPFV